MALTLLILLFGYLCVGLGYGAGSLNYAKRTDEMYDPDVVLYVLGVCLIAWPLSIFGSSDDDEDPTQPPEPPKAGA